MEKKKYVKPEMTVIKIDGKCQMLVGSNTINSTPEKYDDSWDEYVD